MSKQPSLSRRIARTLAVRPSLNANTAVAILVRGASDADDAPWDLANVVPPADRERAVRAAENRGLQVKTQRAADVL